MSCMEQKPKSGDRTERIRAILRKKPYLSIISELESEHSPYLLKNTKSGALSIAIIRMDGKEKFLSSAYDPAREALRMLPPDSEKWKGREIILILGLGNPSILPAVAEKLHPNQICIAVDASADLGLTLIRGFDGALDYLERPGCHLFCGEPMETYLRTYLDAIPSNRIGGLRVISHGSSRNLAPDFYGEIEESVKKTIQTKISDILTRHEFQRTWLRNIICNSRYFPPRIEHQAAKVRVDSRSLEGKLNGIPGLLISAGPSLKDSLDLIAALKDRAFILATDTAYKVLIRKGIIPHAVVTLDAQAHTLMHFLGEYHHNAKIPLFADIVCHPSLIRAAGFRHVIFSTTAKYVQDAAGQPGRERTPGSEFIDEIYGEIGELQSGGSVATTGFDLLRFLGAGTILLVGQDLAYAGRKIHSTGTHHNERWLPRVNRLTSLENINEAVIRKRHTFYTEALDGGEILTDYVLDLYRHWFAESIPQSGVETINLTHRGARIEGATRPDNLMDFVESLPILESPPSFLAEIPEAHIHSHNAVQRIQKSLHETLEGKISFDELMEREPSLHVLAQKGELYAERYARKIGEAEARLKRDEKNLEEAKRLLKGLRSCAASNPDN